MNQVKPGKAVTGIMMLLGIGMCFQSCAKPSRVFPQEKWLVATPASQGLDSVKLDSAMHYLAGVCGPRRTDHTLVIRHGYLVWQGRDIDTAFDVWSCTKSFSSTVLGLLIDDNKCSLKTKAQEILPRLKDKYPDVTLRNFVTMTSGVESITNDQPFEPGEPLFAPGKKFHYGDDLNMFAAILTKIAHEPIRNLFKRRIADPIGMDSAHWYWGDWGPVDGIVVNGGSGTFSKGMHISAREFARIGWLYLNEGQWNGRQLISRSWVEQATQAQTDTTVLPYDTNGWYTAIVGAYGYNFWTNGVRKGSKRLWEKAPPRTFAFQGNFNSYCFVIPEWDMVIVRIGNDQVIDTELYNGLFERIEQSRKN